MGREGEANKIHNSSACHDEKTCPAVKGSLSYVQKSSTQLRRGCEKLHNILRLDVVECYFKVTDQEDENLHSFEDDRPTSERLDDEAFL